jgi:signal peptidase I
MDEAENDRKREGALSRWIFEEEFKRKGSAVLRVKSRSMSPVLKEGDQIEVVYSSPDEILTGDIVVFRSLSQELICHRVVARLQVGGEISFFQAGETSNMGILLPQSRVVGKVIGIRPCGCGEMQRIDDREQWILRNRLFLLTQKVCLICTACSRMFLGRDLRFTGLGIYARFCRLVKKLE